MADRIELSLIEKYGWIEALSRQFFEKYPKLKKAIKKYRNKRAKGSDFLRIEEFGCDVWEEYKRAVNKNVEKGDVILIHSSTDGLAKIGVTADQCMEFLKSLVDEKSCTVVLACFPVTNLMLPTRKSRPYDPKKTLCWTGMLSNMFLADPECIRTRFPYNSLAAIGPDAKDMMEHDLDAVLVYDQNSAWRYCLDHKAKIFFIGVKASGSNTMAIHMLPDVMGDEWPINDWYEKNTYKVKLEDEIIEVSVKVQRGFWYRFVMEEGTSGRLKKAGFLQEQNIKGCNFGVIQDCQSMISYLADEARRGKLTYLIPKKYYKKM